jgi:hypothetical protein
MEYVVMKITNRHRALSAVPSPPVGQQWVYQIARAVQLSQWHHLLAYRVLEQSECTSDAPATAFTGTYLDEVMTGGCVVQQEWTFR